MDEVNSSAEVFASSAANEDFTFDQIIGHIEEIIIDETFEELQNNFMTKHYQEFDDVEENKLEYMKIFKEYQDLIERHLEDQLVKKMPSFSMENFLNTILSKRNELEGEVFEMLLSFSDFLTFKELMLDFKKEKEGQHQDLSDGLVVTSLTKLNISK